MKRFLLCLSLLWPLLAHGVIETYEFRTEEEQQRYQHFIEEMRCPKCQNQNLEDSNSPIAADLRREIYRMVQDGHSDSEIVDFMVARYGEFVLYRPRLDDNTLWLWGAPALFGLLAAIVLFRLSRRRRKAPPAALSTTDHARLDRLLNQDSRE